MSGRMGARAIAPRVERVAGDALAIGVAVTAMLLLAGVGALVTTVAALGAMAIGLVVMAVQGLWRDELTAVRWVELAKLTRVGGALGIAALVVDRLPGSPVPLWTGLAASAAAWVALVVWRSVRRARVGHLRRAGRVGRRVLVVGTDARSLDVIRTFELHPEAGMEVVGVVGAQAAALRAGLERRWVGELADVATAVAATGADCVVVGGPIGADRIEALQDAGCEVFLVPTSSGLAPRRLTATAFADESLVHVESAAPSLVARFVKRAFDIVVAGFVLAVASPVMAVIAVLVKRTDGGPVFFRQQRVGRDDAEFEMLKFRTMVVDAEARLAALATDNQRSGPLFKLAVDPRVTKIGAFLRRTSLDELPQLVNVLRGDMSLVGPRPALRKEVEEFPVALHQRHRVRPGITGLWQVEARDNPAFDAYERLDLHYVQNWSLALDASILLGTIEQLALRPFTSKAQGEMAGAEPAAAFAA